MEFLIENIGLKKIVSTIGIFLLIILFVVVAFLATRQPDDFIIINGTCILTKRGSKWEQVKDLNDNILSKKYTVIHDGGSSDKVTINYSSDLNLWTYMNSEYKDLTLERVKVAYTDKFKNLKAIDYEISYYDKNDDDILKEVLKDKKISDFENSVFKFSGDLDNDGTDEVIYTLNNQSLSGVNEGNYSAIFLVKDGNIISKFDGDTSKPYMVTSIIDLDGDGNFEIIVSKGDLDISTFNSCYQIYTFKNDKVSLIKDCR